MKNEKGDEGLNFILNKLWVIAVVINIFLILFGVVSNILSYSVILLSPEDIQVSVEVVSDTGSFKSAVNFVLGGVVIALFIITVILLIIFLLKRRREKKEVRIPEFDVFGMQQGLR